MSDQAFELVLLEEVDDPADAARQALASRFALEASGSHVVRRTWLDTFDWRLHRAGLVLEQSEAGGQSWLTLTSGSGERLSCTAAPLSWPGAVARLPATPLRERVDGVAGIRALMPVAQARSSVQEIRVLNDDAKTVARVVVDHPATRGRSSQAFPAHMSVVPVRGYGHEGSKCARILGDLPGVETSDASVYEQALASAGRAPGDYSSKVNVSLSPSMPAAMAVAVVLQSFLAGLEANVAGAIADVDTEFLHDLRVAVRRTRSVLKLTGDVLPDSLAERFVPSFKWLGDMTTPTRDLDVFLLGFQGMAGDLQAAAVADLDAFHAHLFRRRKAEQRRLARVLQSRRFEQILADWRVALNDVVSAASEAPEGPTALAVAEERVSHAYRRVVKHGSTINPASPAEQLHTLRKRCKELRYLLEIFSSLHEPSAHRRIVGELKDLQECLGDFQDSEVQRAAVGEFATQMTSAGTVPAPTLLAMGELAARLEAHQRWARSDYAGRFDRFMRRKNRQAVEHLTGVTVA